MGIPAVPRRSGRYPGLAAFRRFCESSPGISLSQCDGLACRRTIQKVSQGLIQTLYFRMSEPLSYPVMQALFDSVNRLCKTAPFIAQGQDNLATVAGIFAANDPTPPDRCRNQTAWASMLANQPAPQFLQGNRFPFGKAAQDFGLRWSQLQRRQHGSKLTIAFTLGTKDQETKFFFGAHAACLCSFVRKVAMASA